MYAMRIDVFLLQALHYIFVSYNNQNAKAHHIKQLERNAGLDFKALHTLIHQSNHGCEALILSLATII